MQSPAGARLVERAIMLVQHLVRFAPKGSNHFVQARENVDVMDCEFLVVPLSQQASIT